MSLPHSVFVYLLLNYYRNEEQFCDSILDSVKGLYIEPVQYIEQMLTGPRSSTWSLQMFPLSEVTEIKNSSPPPPPPG